MAKAPGAEEKTSADATNTSWTHGASTALRGQLHESSVSSRTWVHGLALPVPGPAASSVLLLSVTAKELYPQGDVVVPLAGVYPHIAGKEGWLQGVHHCAGVVLVCLENLERREKAGVLSAVLGSGAVSL